MSERFSMKEFRPLSLLEKKQRIDEAIIELEKEKMPHVDTKRECETELSDLNSRIRVGDFEGDEGYKTICNRQQLLKKKKAKHEQKIIEVNRKIREKHLERDKVDLDRKKMPKGEAESLLLELRDKYMSFAADTTRVSSMRAMSSKFVEEIQFILKTIQQ